MATHKHSIYDTDLHFIIDPITRKISSESGKVSLMQLDHNSERFTFQIPRIIEGHDMSLSDRVEIHYNNIDSGKRLQKSDVYIADDVQTAPDDDNVVIFSWLISQNATTYSGVLEFIVRFVCLEDTEIVYQWFSDVYSTIKINKGIYNTETVVEDYSDMITTWNQEMISYFEASETNSNLAKSYSQSASTSASAAKTSETNAASSASAAKTAQTAAENALTDVNTRIDQIQTTSSGTLSEAGWYRVAEIDATISYSACALYISNNYYNDNSETHGVLFNHSYNNAKIEPIFHNTCNTIRLFTKARVVSDSNKGYIEVYYASSKPNPCIVTISHYIKAGGGHWQAITPTLTAEEVDGVTVTATYDIPANASPVTDLDLARHDVTYVRASTLDEFNALFENDESYNVTKKVIFVSFSETVLTSGFPYYVETYNFTGGSRRFQLIQGYAGGKPYIYSRIYVGTWGEFIILATTSDLATELAKYLPKTGGEVNGNLTARAQDASERFVAIQNSLRAIYHVVGDSGYYALYDANNGKNIIASTKDGTTTFNGTATGNLALDGEGAQQVITSATTTPLKFAHPSRDMIGLQFEGVSGTLGYLGMYGVNTPKFVESDGETTHSLLHSGNSNAVISASSAPTDTAALWYDTENHVLKSYVDGAWQ